MMQPMPRPMSENGPSVFGIPPSALAAMASRDFRPVYCAIDMRLPLCFGIPDFQRWAEIETHTNDQCGYMTLTMKDGVSGQASPDHSFLFPENAGELQIILP